MRKHLTDGELRAALDGEMESAQIQHIGSCAECQSGKDNCRKKAKSPHAYLHFCSHR
jgi:hypothetical protein